MKTIEIIIDPQGKIRLQTKGYSGISCKEASKAIEQALGLVQTDQPTPEMYTHQSSDQHEQQRS
jgi:hypothetical protein